MSMIQKARDMFRGQPKGWTRGEFIREWERVSKGRGSAKKLHEYLSAELSIRTHGQRVCEATERIANVWVFNTKAAEKEAVERGIVVRGKLPLAILRTLYQSRVPMTLAAIDAHVNRPDNIAALVRRLEGQGAVMRIGPHVALTPAGKDFYEDLLAADTAPAPLAAAEPEQEPPAGTTVEVALATQPNSVFDLGRLAQQRATASRNLPM